ncbi:MAG: glutamate-1-semialdehyde 2,1-aminomutase [Oligoflexia bacterium]|nr:glutamate-1-semialdehyde 2,1-aminomutase [Oligoflexia bacterium]
MSIHTDLFDRSKKVSPGGVHSPVRSFKNLGMDPLFFRSANGAYITDMEGKEYIDFCQSFGPLLLGHRDADVEKAVIEQIHTAWTFGAPEPYSLELAEWITKRISWVEKLRFVSSGTEAVMSAIRIARAATGRDKVLKFDGCYHGHMDSLLVQSGSGLAGESSSTSAGISESTAAQTLVCNLDDDTMLEKIFSVHGKELACLVIEPLPANYGLLIQRQDFIEKAVSLAKAHGTLVLFDEVISGFRVALGGMAELLNIRPDLVCYGKILGGGFPVGCYGGRNDLMDLVAPAGPVYQAGTLSANPIGMRAGLASLQKCERLNVWEKLKTRTHSFVSALSEGLNELNLSVSSHNSIFWIHTKTQKPIRSITEIPSEHGKNFAPFFRSCLKRGIYLAPSGYEVGFLSLAHSEEILQSSAKKIIEAAYDGKNS